MIGHGNKQIIVVAFVGLTLQGIVSREEDQDLPLLGRIRADAGQEAGHARQLSEEVTVC